MNQLPGRNASKVTVIIVGLVVVAAAVFYFSGSYDKWRDDSALGEACDGMLPTTEMHKFFGDVSPVRAKNSGSEKADSGQLGECIVSAGSGEIGLRIEATKGSAHEGQAEAIKHRFLGDPLVMAVPLGGGWRGSVTYEDDLLYGSVEIPCTREGQQDESAVASVQTSGADAELNASAKRRMGFARILTEFARSVAGRADCKAKAVGGKVESLAKNPLPEKRSVREATGTCAPVREMGEEAGKLGLSHIQEAPTDATSVAEDCYMLHDGDEAYRLSALYGGYAKSAKSAVNESGIQADAEAVCPSSPNRALYTLSLVQNNSWRPVEQGKVKFERAVLKAFAERSAKHHGCRDVRVS